MDETKLIEAAKKFLEKESNWSKIKNTNLIKSTLIEFASDFAKSDAVLEYWNKNIRNEIEIELKSELNMFD